MAGEVNFLDVHILGREYRVLCSPGEEDALIAAVRLVSDQMQEISNKSRNSTPERVAVMAALNIAHDYLAAQTEGRAGASKEIETNFDSTGLKRRIEVMDTRLAALLEMPVSS
ncbi:MAG: cell division protein ZapA [Zoogloeaceae bacterium]|jgi:cell division protein ZapA|nr:cell division protein ZapA [Zoogloeaceae bacterium]